MSNVKQTASLSVDASSNTVASAGSSDSSGHATGKRRPYEAPAFIITQAFERQALSCAGCLNQAGGWPSFCGMKS